MPMVMDNRFIWLFSTPSGVRLSKPPEGEMTDVPEGKCLRFTGEIVTETAYTRFSVFAQPAKVSVSTPSR